MCFKGHPPRRQSRRGLKRISMAYSVDAGSQDIFSRVLRNDDDATAIT